MNELVQGQEVYYGSPAARGFLYQKQAAVETRVWVRNYFQNPFRHHCVDLREESESTLRIRPVRWKCECEGGREVPEWYPVSISEDRYHPGICPYGRPLSPVVHQAPPYSPRRGDRVSWRVFQTLCPCHRSCRNGRWGLRLLFSLLAARELAWLLLRGICYCRGTSGELPDVTAEWLA